MLNPSRLYKNKLVPLAFFFILCVAFIAPTSMQAQGSWSSNSFTGVYPHKRHESAFIQVGDKFYLLGGRKTQFADRRVKEFDFNTNTWSDKAVHPLEMHHFQAVELDGMIYVVCGMRGNFPNESPLTNIYIYDPVNDTWTTGPEIPLARRRGSSGAIVHDGKIYVVNGIQNGHSSGWVNWTDVFDPETNTWTQLADSPIARDHFSAEVVNDKIYIAGGRQSGSGANVFSGTIPQVDVYDITNDTWSTLASSSDIPTERAGCMSAVLNNHLVILGGEKGTSTQAEDVVEALDLSTNIWATWAPMAHRRHGTQAILNNGKIYLAAGAGPNRGGNEIDTPNVHFMSVGDYAGSSSPSGTAVSKGTFAPTPATINYGTVAVGNSFSLNAKLKNNSGNQGLIITSLNLSGSDNAEFTINLALTLPIVIPPGDSAIIPVSFDPATTGNKSASLEANTSGSTSLTTVSLIGLANNSGLPVEWLSFEAEYVSSSVNLKWITGKEINHDFYLVERSVKGGEFETLERLDGGDNREVNQYTAVDTKPAWGNNIYRIKQVDIDGSFSYSPLVELEVLPANIQIYPNPLSDSKNLSIIQSSPTQKLELKIYTLAGQEVKQIVIERNDLQPKSVVSLTELAAGSYFVTISGQKGLIKRSILLIQ